MRTTLLILPGSTNTVAALLSSDRPAVLAPWHDKPLLLRILRSLETLRITQLIICAKDQPLWDHWRLLLAEKINLILIDPVLFEQDPQEAWNMIGTYLSGERRLLVHSATGFFDQLDDLSTVQDCLFEAEHTTPTRPSVRANLDVLLLIINQPLVWCELAALSGDLVTTLAGYEQSIGLTRHLLPRWHAISSNSSLGLYHQFSHHQIERHRLTMTKSGEGDALAAEAFYYQNNTCKALFPRIDQISATSITMQFWPAHSLAYYFLFHPLPTESQADMVNQLWHLLHQELYTVPAKAELSSVVTEKMYGERVVTRVETWQQELSTDELPLVQSKTVYCNGLQLVGWPRLAKLVTQRAKTLAETAVIRQIHGDLHFANILYAPEQQLFCLLDPRGAWGDQYTVYGDVRYDMAKFLHSFHGGYEMIKNGLSSFEEEDAIHYRLQIPPASVASVDCVKQLCHRWQIDIQDVFWIEALCFLSMSKFYPSRSLQKQFFLQGLLLINQLL